MRVADFLDMSPEDISKLKYDERKELVDQMAKIANRRIRALENRGMYSPALASRQDIDLGGALEFSSENKNNNELQNELKFLNMFLSNKTSTVTGATNYQVDLMARLTGNTKKNIREHLRSDNAGNQSTINGLFPDEAASKTFWSGYNKVVERRKGIIDNFGSKGSSELQGAIYETFQASGFTLSSDELWEIAEEMVDNDYMTKAPAEFTTPYSLVRNA